MRFIFKGVVAATKNKKLPVIYVEKIDYSFEVYAEKPLQIPKATAKGALTGEINLKAKVENYLKATRMDYTVTFFDEDPDSTMIEIEGTNYILGHYKNLYQLQKVRHIGGTYYDPPDTDIKEIMESDDFFTVMRELSLCLIDETIQDLKEREYEAE